MRGFESTPPDVRELLPRRFSDLALEPEGSPVERYVSMLHRELEKKGLKRFRPPCYPTDEWGCPPDHTVYLIEANPNPYRHSRAEFMKSARASGRTHPGTVLEIVGLALARYGLPA